MRKIYYFIITTTLLSLFSCKKYNDSKTIDGRTPQELSKTQYEISNETKQYFLFKYGSWWKFKNEITSQTDCLYVTDCFNYFSYSIYDTLGFDIGIKKEYCKTEFLLKTLDSVFIEYNFDIQTNQKHIETINSDFFSNHSFYKEIQLYSLDTNISIENIPNVSINGNSYYNCIQIKNKTFITKDSINVIIAKDIGVVKYVHKKDSILIRNISLLTYNVKK